MICWRCEVFLPEVEAALAIHWVRKRTTKWLRKLGGAVDQPPSLEMSGTFVELVGFWREIGW